MDMILEKYKFPIVLFLIVSNICLEVHIGIVSMRQFQCVPTLYVFSLIKFITISLFNQIFNHFPLFKEMSM